MAKYLWGNDPFPMGVMFGLAVLSGLVVGLLLMHVGSAAAVGDTYPSAVDMRGVALVTCAFLLVWYSMLGNQVSIKFAKGLSSEVSEGAKFIADRSVVNTLEQSIAFLSLMWMHAIFVNPQTARLLGWIYVVTRLLYPVFYGFYGGFTVAVEAATQPNYVIIFYYMMAITYKCLWDTDLHVQCGNWIVLVGLLASFGSFIAFLGLAMPTTQIIVAGVKAEKDPYGAADDEEEDEDEEDARPA